MSLHSKWLKEYHNKEILENEYGFITYWYPNETTIYLEDIYIVPEQRNKKIGLDLVNQAIEIGKEKGCIQSIGSLDPNTVLFQKNLDNMLTFGYKISHIHGSLIILKKDIK